jgi:hypothetical protein
MRKDEHQNKETSIDRGCGVLEAPAVLKLYGMTSDVI